MRLSDIIRSTENLTIRTYNKAQPIVASHTRKAALVTLDKTANTLYRIAYRLDRLSR